MFDEIWAWIVAFIILLFASAPPEDTTPPDNSANVCDSEVYRNNNDILESQNGLYLSRSPEAILTVDYNDGLRIISFEEGYNSYIDPVVGETLDDLKVCGANVYQESFDHHIPLYIVDEESVISVSFSGDAATVSGTVSHTDNYGTIMQTFDNSFTRLDNFVSRYDFVGTYKDDDGYLTLKANGSFSGGGYTGVFEDCRFEGQLNEDIEDGFYTGALTMSQCKYSAHMHNDGDGADVALFAYDDGTKRNVVISFSSSWGFPYIRRY